MKQSIKSKFLKAVISTLIVTTVLGGVVYAYVALTSTGQVEVKESLPFVGVNTFNVNLYPQESKSVQLTIANASSVASDVDLTSNISPDPGAKGLIVAIPNKITVPAGGQTTLTITISAGKSAEPQAYTVTIFFDR